MINPTLFKDVGAGVEMLLYYKGFLSQESSAASVTFWLQLGTPWKMIEKAFISATYVTNLTAIQEH